MHSRDGLVVIDGLRHYCQNEKKTRVVIPGLVISIVNRRKPNSFPVDRGGAADDFGHRMAVMSSHLRMLFALLLSE